MITPARPAVVKAMLRREALARRAALGAEERARAAERIAGATLPVVVAPGTTIAGYAPMRGEIDVLPLLRRLERAGARLALPAVAEATAPLLFRAWHCGEPLERGRHGTLEPTRGNPALTPEILLVPLAGFDRAGHRIGYGGGYYDRTLAALRARRPTTAIGVAFAAQEVDLSFAEMHDARLDFVLTEAELIDCRRPRG